MFNKENIMNQVAESIYNSILTDVSNSVYAPGSKIPTENELAKEFDTNRMNAHYAIKELEKEGIVLRNKKQGSLINPNISPQRILDLRNFFNNRVYIMASLSEASHLHWNESALTDLEQTLSANGYSVSILDLPCDKGKFSSSFMKISKTGSRAIFIFPDHSESCFLMNNIELLNEFHGDVYLLNRGVDTFHRLPCHILSLDPFDEGIMAGKYLWEKGFRNIIFAANMYDDGYYWLYERKDGVAMGVDIASSGKGRANLLHMPRVELFPKLAESIKNSNGNTAVVAQTDAFAVELMEQMSKRGLEMPKDFSVLGFGNDIKYRRYNLTTTAPPVDVVGKTFAEMMLHKDWRNSNGVKLNLKLKSRIIERASTTN
jgi:GntR family transcriptional regulator of arabinose operon